MSALAESVAVEPVPPVDETWTRIKAEALAQIILDLARLHETPLAFGQHLAWVTHEANLTAELSPLHRVGFPIDARPYTGCGERIPPPICWLPLSPALIATMPRCKFCVAEYERAVRLRDAA